jgi:hypothetical protein
VAVWTLGAVLVIASTTARRPKGEPYTRIERAGLGLVIAVAAILGVVVTILLLPEGLPGLKEFVCSTVGDVFASAGSSAEEVPPALQKGPGPLTLLTLLPRALEGGAHNPELRWRANMLLIAGFVFAFSAMARVILSRMFRELDDGAILGAVALSWVVPLSLLPLDRWPYPLGYRYWLLPLALCAILLGAEVGRWVGVRKIGIIAVMGSWTVGLFLVSPVLDIERSIVAPAPTRAQALAAAGAHRMGPRPGHGRHDAFLALSAHLSIQDRASLLEGYGMALGGDAAVNAQDGLTVIHEWDAIGRRWGPRERTALLVGVGCGATALSEVPARLIESWVAAVADQEYLLYGLGLCAAEAGRVPRPEVEAAVQAFPALAPVGWKSLGEGLRDGGMPRAELIRFAPDEQVLAHLIGGWDSPPRRKLRRSTVDRPAALMPLRW